ncbi:unnamed protein product [Lupinus luteus]|uniref:Uncharacterized protein n=1 Tax=Lupinus luteus TaxID=3873 RepID=A0AAV1WMP9_LUPLU
MVEGACKKFVMIVDESELVNHIGGSSLSMLQFEENIGDLKVASDAILNLVGVVEHGMLLDVNTSVIIAGDVVGVVEHAIF